ncbi:MAG: aminopeptidase N, partial [Anaerolineae bacterium]|nr:aminopeptidase N [Anaerolineae bacterium]
WEAGQRLGERVIRDLLQQPFDAWALPEHFRDAFRTTLLDTTLDPALKAQTLTLPSEGYIAGQIGHDVDPVAIHLAREFLRRTLAEALTLELEACYGQHRDQGPYEFSAYAMGRRALQNLCLAYLIESGQESARQRAQSQLDEANNMTNAMGALQALNQIDSTERDQALAGFYERWREDVLVVNKWLGLQAMSKVPGSLARVRVLMEHEAFDMRNPNKVRALIGSFCAGNPAQFHAEDGSGYAFLGEQVKVLNELNPQIAARLVQPLSRWRLYDKPRQ